MVWYIVIAIIVVLIVRYFFSFKGRVRNIAKAHLATYQAVRIANPNAKPDDIYKQVIKSRAGFADKIEFVYGFASQLKEQRDGMADSWDVNFMWIVMALCVIETSGGKTASGKRLTTIYNVTRAIIPDNI